MANAEVALEHVDFLVLGAGTAGMVAAHRVAAAGRKVAVIDPGPIGGLCSLRGCNPKKILVRATEVLDAMRAAGEHGISSADARVDWSTTIDRKHHFTDPVPARARKSLEASKIEYIAAAGRFAAPDRVTAGERLIAFEAALIATGSTPRPLSFPGAEHLSTSDDLLDLRTPPRRMAIVGSGAVAFELGQAYARLGTEVHMLMRHAEALRRFEQDIVQPLLNVSRELGIELHPNTETEAVEPDKTGYRIHLSGGQPLPADVVLNAAGRVPAVDTLDLPKAHVDYTDHGVKVNKYLRGPDNPRVFAAGDAHGRMQLSPIAGYEGRLVARNFLEGNVVTADYDPIPMALYTVPPLATVGLTQAEAEARELRFDTVHEDMSEWTVFAIEGSRRAAAKVLYEQESGRVLGAHLFGSRADEFINLFAMAMRYDIPRDRLREMVFTYPAFSSVVSSLL